MTKKHRQEALAQEAREKVRKPLTEDDDLNNVRYKAKYRYETKQPLTREQMEKIYYSVLLNTENFWWDFARAIERAHGIGVEDE